MKTAIFGSDPNWGRIAMAVGRAPRRRSTRTGSTSRSTASRCAAAGWPRATGTPPTCPGDEIAVEVDLGLGEGAAEILTTDLSHAYVEENSAYSS